MNVKFTNTTSSKLNSLAVTNGQLIALSDTARLYYDLNSTRRCINPQGTSSTFGMLKVSDQYTTSAGTAAGGVAASSYALTQVYRETALKVGKIWTMAGRASGINSVTIPKSTLDAIADLVALIQIPLGTSMNGKVYYTSILKLTDMVLGGFYYDSKYYASVALRTNLNTDGSLSLSVQGNWTKIVYNGVAQSLDSCMIEVWYR